MSESAIKFQFPFRTQRLQLRPLCAGDRDEFIRVHKLSVELFRPWSPRMEDGETFESLFDRQLDRTLKGLESGRDVRLAGFDGESKLVGIFNLNDIVRGVFCSGNAGWRVSADRIKQGYGAEGVTALLDVAFAPPPLGLGLHRVQAAVIPGNAASNRLAGRVGFRREGLALRYVKIAGAWQDHIIYAKLADEHRPLYVC